MKRIADKGTQTSLNDCLIAASKNKEFVAKYDRLTGSNLTLKGSLLDLEIDKATGRLDSELDNFIEFVYKYVFLTFRPTDV